MKIFSLMLLIGLVGFGPLAVAKKKPPTNAKVKIQDLKKGKGAVAKSGMTVTVNYVGKLTDGTKFDASADHGEAFKFKLGNGDVIKGWDQGVEGMRVGGKRKLTVPPELGYGSNGIGAIPPNATLVFEIELLSVAEG